MSISIEFCVDWYIEISYLMKYKISHFPTWLIYLPHKICLGFDGFGAKFDFVDTNPNSLCHEMRVIALAHAHTHAKSFRSAKTFLFIILHLVLDYITIVVHPQGANRFKYFVEDFNFEFFRGFWIFFGIL